MRFNALSKGFKAVFLTLLAVMLVSCQSGNENMSEKSEKNTIDLTIDSRDNC